MCERIETREAVSKGCVRQKPLVKASCVRQWPLACVTMAFGKGLFAVSV